jgi:hypothetical protein
MQRLQILFRLIILCGCYPLLAACANQGTVAAFQSRSGEIALRQYPRSGYFVAIGPHEVLPLGGYTAAYIKSIWETPSASLVVIAGRRADCPLSYSLVVAKADGSSITPIGDCGETYTFAQDGSMFVIRQTQALDQRVWIFENGALHGPMLVALHRARRRSHTEGTNPGRKVDNPILPPPISAPVGNEVIPQPVGSSGPTFPEANASHH